MAKVVRKVIGGCIIKGKSRVLWQIIEELFGIKKCSLVALESDREVYLGESLPFTGEGKGRLHRTSEVKSRDPEETRK